MKTRQEQYLEAKDKVNSINSLKNYLMFRGYKIDEILKGKENLTFFVNFKEFGYIVILGPENLDLLETGCFYAIHTNFVRTLSKIIIRSNKEVLNVMLKDFNLERCLEEEFNNYKRKKYAAKEKQKLDDSEIELPF